MRPMTSSASMTTPKSCRRRRRPPRSAVVDRPKVTGPSGLQSGASDIYVKRAEWSQRAALIFLFGAGRSSFGQPAARDFKSARFRAGAELY